MTEAVEAEKLSRFASDKFSALSDKTDQLTLSDKTDQLTLSDKRDEPTLSDKTDQLTSNSDINMEESKSNPMLRTTR